MKKCIKCGKEMPQDTKAVLCEHCKGSIADGTKKAVQIGITAIGTVVGLAITVGTMGKINIKK